jgi:hypothetical protein
MFDSPCRDGLAKLDCRPPGHILDDPFALPYRAAAVLTRHFPLSLNILKIFLPAL